MGATINRPRNKRQRRRMVRADFLRLQQRRRGGGSKPEVDLVARAISAAFTPGQLGALYLIQPEYDGQTLLWSDEAGTTPAVVDGPVRMISDLSGGGNHATTPDPATLRKTPGGYHLEFDGETSYYNIPASLARNSPSLYMAFSGQYRELAGQDMSMIWFSTGLSGTSTRARLNTRATNYLQAAGRRLDEDGFDTGAQAEVISASEPFSASCLLNYSDASAWLRKNGNDVGIESPLEFSTPGLSSDTDSLESYLGWQAGEYTPMDARMFAVITGGTDGIPEMEGLLASLGGGY